MEFRPEDVYALVLQTLKFTDDQNELNSYILKRLCIDDTTSVLDPTVHLRQFYETIILPDPALASAYQAISNPTSKQVSPIPNTPSDTTTNENDTTNKPPKKSTKSNSKATTWSNYGQYDGKIALKGDIYYLVRQGKQPSICKVYTLQYSDTALSMLSSDDKKKLELSEPFIACEVDMVAFLKSPVLKFGPKQTNPWAYNISIPKHITLQTNEIPDNEEYKHIAAKGLPLHVKASIITEEGTSTQ